MRIEQPLEPEPVRQHDAPLLEFVAPAGRRQALLDTVPGRGTPATGEECRLSPVVEKLLGGKHAPRSRLGRRGLSPVWVVPQPRRRPALRPGAGERALQPDRGDAELFEVGGPVVESTW